MSDSNSELSNNRRTFLKTSSAAVASGLALSSSLSSAAFAEGDEELKVGVIGCGGRGMGAVRDTLQADPYSKLVAMADMFPSQLESGLKNIQKGFPDRVAVTPETMFSGFDAYQKLLATDAQIVILATPPHFRPIQLEAAIKAGKHVFCEKPVAVDPVGCRKVYDISETARAKGLTLVSGLCWRYEDGMKEIIKRIHDGQIGDITAVYSTRFNNGVEKRQPRTEGMSEIEYQLRNWYYYTWLSADFFAEQFVHELDKVAWTLGEYPTRCISTGGRETRTGEKNGNVFDHFSTVFEYESGLRYHATTRQQAGCENEFQDLVYGTKGMANLMKYTITGQEPWRKKRNVNRMYFNEHVALYDSIRNGKALNNGEYMVKSSLMGIMARMSAYTGKSLTWDQAWNSELDLSPTEYSFEGTPPSKDVAVPGVTPLV